MSSTIVYASSYKFWPSRIGAMVDDQAPHSSIGEVELSFHGKCLLERETIVEDHPKDFGDAQFWQFCLRDHASPRRRILVSANLHLTTHSMCRIAVRNIVIEGSPQWILGRSITRMCNILHICRHAFDSYYSGQAVSKCSSVKRLVDRVHRHVCGHPTYSDIRTRFKRNFVWTNHVQHYLVRVFSSCTCCKTLATPLVLLRFCNMCTFGAGSPKPSCVSRNPQPPTKRGRMYRTFERRHGQIRSIFILLKQASANT